MNTYRDKLCGTCGYFGLFGKQYLIYRLQPFQILVFADLSKKNVNLREIGCLSRVAIF